MRLKDITVVVNGYGVLLNVERTAQKNWWVTSKDDKRHNVLFGLIRENEGKPLTPKKDDLSCWSLFAGPLQVRIVPLKP